MKLQNLVILFIIILLPVIIFLTYYTHLQKMTLNMQTKCNSKLIEATKQAIEAFEVNTTEWNAEFAKFGESKRRDVFAATNAFITSFSNSLNITAASKEDLLTYIPAIMFNLYDGYYIYTPTKIPKVAVDENGNGKFDEDGNLLYESADGNNIPRFDTVTEKPIETNNRDEAYMIYKHILKPFIPYSEKVKVNGENYVINYTLDNFIKVYYKPDPTSVDSRDKNGKREGYLIYINNDDDILSNIKPEELSENIMFLYNDELKEGSYSYVYNQNKEKCYYDNVEYEFFRIFANERIDLDTLPSYEYKILYKNNTKYYQVLNQLFDGDEKKGHWFNNAELTDPTLTTEIPDDIEYPIDKDFSAINYYAEAEEFKNWVNGLGIDFLKIDENNDPMDENSLFNVHKKEVMKNSIIANLRLAVSSYSAHSNIEYKLPKFTFEDWEQILENVSLTAFIQGMPIGLKYYNNYSIAISSNNNEYINPKEIYYISSDEDSENYYHRKNCDKLIIDMTRGEYITGYRNTDFNIKTFINNDNIYHYFKHKNRAYGCYYCIISNSLNSNSLSSGQKTAYSIAYANAIARERYNQIK